MNKILSAILILALALMVMASCSPVENDKSEDGEHNAQSSTPNGGGNNIEEDEREAPAPENNFYLAGKVTGISDRIEIDVTDGEYAYGVYWILVSGETEILDANGNTISLDGIKIGDTVEVTYGGQVMMSYPPQVSAIKVKLR